MERLVVYSRPWEKLSWEDVAEEYSEYKLPFKEYVHHLIRREEGVVALAREEWELCEFDLPRSAELWDPQYATSHANYEALRKLRIVKDEYGNRVVAAGEDLRAVGKTTIIRPREEEDGYWYLTGAAITLAQLLFEFRRNYTVAELMYWYFNATKICRKRPHAWGHPDIRRAASLRYQKFGHHGHFSKEVVGREGAVNSEAPTKVPKVIRPSATETCSTHE